MSFSFQVNNELEFNHDETLLAKAEALHPTIHKETKHPIRIVDIVEDNTKLGGYWTFPSTKDIAQLHTYPMKRNDVIILDFGDHMVGSFSIHIDQTGSPMDAPIYMRLRFAEMPVELTMDSKDYDGWLSRPWIQEDFIHLDELPTTLSLPRRYSFRYVEIKIIDTSPKWQALFSNPTVVTETSADYTKLKPCHIKDEQLQEIYDVGVKTLSECMQDVFEDGPKRDQRLWLGDLRLQALANYATFDNVDLVKRCLYLFAAMTTKEGKIPANVFVKPKNIPDDTFLFEYSLFFISVLYDLNKAHPDPEFVKELYPIAKRQMDITLGMFDSNGKLIPDENYPIFVDWSNTYNKDTAGQGEVIYVLKQFIDLGKIVNDEQISHYEETLAKITQYAIDNLFDPRCYLFRTTGNEYNIASQVWMVLAHVMDDYDNKEIMLSTYRNLFPLEGIVTPYMYHHLAEAFFEADLPDKGLSQMINYWGKMIDLGADTFWEAFDPNNPNFSPYGSAMVNSYCHAWSCSPVYLIKKYLSFFIQ